MAMPRLQVQTTQARLGYNIQKPTQTIRQPKADQSIQQPQAKIAIRQQSGKLTIDQTKAWNNIDLKSIFKRTDAMVADAKQLWMQGLSRMSREGDELMRIENKGNPISTHAAKNARYEFFIEPGGLPAYELVDIRYQPSFTDMSAERREPIIQTRKREPEISYQQGNVNFALEQFPDIQIDWKV